MEKDEKQFKKISVPRSGKTWLQDQNKSVPQHVIFVSLLNFVALTFFSGTFIIQVTHTKKLLCCPNLTIWSFEESWKKTHLQKTSWWIGITRTKIYNGTKTFIWIKVLEKEVLYDCFWKAWLIISTENYVQLHPQTFI